MSTLFIDTGAFYAVRDPKDQHHAAARAAFAELARGNTRLFSTEHVFDETISLLARRESYGYAAEAGAELLASREIVWVKANDEDWHAALAWMRKLADQSVSFTDCVSFAVMRRTGVEEVFGFDRHFRAAGFRLWPEDR